MIWLSLAAGLQAYILLGGVRAWGYALQLLNKQAN